LPIVLNALAFGNRFRNPFAFPIGNGCDRQLEALSSDRSGEPPEHRFDVDIVGERNWPRSYRQ
jgi:hypothetical protein